MRKFQLGVDGNLLRDDLIALTSPPVKNVYPVALRRIVTWVDVDGVWREMGFLTNNREWSAQTMADRYRCRWSIAVFFKQIKQTLQLADFLGNSANAVRWQVWRALLTYVLLRSARLAKTRTPPPARSLWDSRWRRLVSGHTRAGLSGRIQLTLGDSRFA